MRGVAESAAEGSRNDQKPLVLAGRDRLKPETIISPLNEENPCKTRVFDSSEGGTRTRDPRLMKPVPTIESDDVTGNPDNELQNQEGKFNSRAQQKAQHAESDERTDPELRRLVNLWRLLGDKNRSTLLRHAVRLAETDNQRIGG